MIIGDDCEIPIYNNNEKSTDDTENMINILIQ